MNARPNVTVWADGFGAWHVRVSTHAASPLIAARRGLRDAITEREATRTRPDIPQWVWLHPVRVPALDAAETIVYRERFREEATS